MEWDTHNAQRKILSTRNSISNEISLKYEREIETFPGKQRLKELIVSIPAWEDTQRTSG